jgi:integrase
MTEKINFTMAALKALKPSTARRWVYDAKVSGLVLMVTPAGSKSFYHYRKHNGRPERIRLGGFPELSVDTARELATEHNANYAKGINPAESRRMKRREHTMQELFDRYIEEYATPRKKAYSVTTDKATWQRYTEGLRSRKISSITEEDIKALHLKVGKKTPYAANRLLALLSKMFNFGGHPNPCRGVEAFPEESRDRFLQPDELPRFLAAIDSLENQTIADAFRLMLFTGARKSNVLAMRWDELDLSGGNWRIPAAKSKNNKTLPVHLPETAVAIITKLKDASDGSSPFVFPCRNKGERQAKPIQDVKFSWNLVREKSGLKDLRMHDLRRSLGSWMAAGGASLPVIGKTLGHRNQTTTAVYARLNIDPVREAVNAAVAAMQAAGKTVDGSDGNQ